LQSINTLMPVERRPEWQEIRGLPLDEQRARLLDPTVRERLVKAAHHSDYGPDVGAEARRPDYDLIRVWRDPVPPNPTVSEVADERNVDPVEAMIDLAIETGFDQFFLQPMQRYDYEDQVRVLKHPRTVMTFSDSGAHVSQVADASIPTHLLAYWVRREQQFTLEEAVRMLTYVPATFWRFPDRGLVREGFVADLNVLDPATVAPRMPEVAHDLPGGAKRLIQKADGFLATVVAGQPTVLDGEPTGALPGALLRG